MSRDQPSGSADFRRLNPHLFGGPGLTGDEPISAEHDALMRKVLPAPAGKKRLRQSAAPVMNKLEERFYETKLRIDYLTKGEAVLIQAVRLELARGIWYKPDFFLPAVQGDSSCLDEGRPAIAYEVKGPKAFRGGFENLKVAARVHPWIKFFLVWEDKGTWQRQQILP